jgi:co-chaperonin GroES (HSP10)
VIKKNKNNSLKADIVTDDSEDKELITGEILAVGPDASSKIGDTVIFGKYSIFKLTLFGEEIFFLDEEDVIAQMDDVNKDAI